jgi:phosphonatase-like hydrolase
MIKMVVFDMAGTTVNEDNVVYKTLRKAINEAGYDFTLDQVLLQGAGKEKLQAIKSILQVYAQNSDAALADIIYAKFVDYLDKAYDTLAITQQPHATELFHALKKMGIWVVLNTGYNFKTASSLVDKLGWTAGIDYDGLVTASDVLHNRPQPDMILLAMEKFNISNPQQVVKVGDSIIDIEEGKNAGCRLNIGITTGAHTHAQLLTGNPDYIIHDLMELIPLLTNTAVTQ